MLTQIMRVNHEKKKLMNLWAHTEISEEVGLSKQPNGGIRAMTKMPSRCDEGSTLETEDGEKADNMRRRHHEQRQQGSRLVKG